MGSLPLEIRYALRERTVLAALAFVFFISGYAVITGALEARQQQQEIQILQQQTQADQAITLREQGDAGGAAYYIHHVTYQPPSHLAFAALGTREGLPWKHRLRMLALEGQIYEADTGNPELSRLGRLDFAFVIALLLPLVLILLLYDLEGRERREGRYELLNTTSVYGSNTLHLRAGARTLLLFGAAVIPFIAMALVSRATFVASALVLVVVFLHLVFWCCICRVVTTKCAQAPTAATFLLALWLLMSSAVPAAGRIAVESIVPVPAGGEILLAQREAINDAWDLPKATTMQPFVASHPEWSEYAEVTQPFEWKWYYAFHQVGDESVAEQTQALENGIVHRDSLMGWIAVLSPPLAAERWLTRIAGTDRLSHQRYIQCVRAFHAKLREFHYPMLFGEKDYSMDAMAKLPKYASCND